MSLLADHFNSVGLIFTQKVAPFPQNKDFLYKEVTSESNVFLLAIIRKTTKSWRRSSREGEVNTIRQINNQGTVLKLGYLRLFCDETELRDN